MLRSAENCTISQAARAGTADLSSPKSRAVIGSFGLSYLGAEDILSSTKSTPLSRFYRRCPQCDGRRNTPTFSPTSHWMGVVVLMSCFPPTIPS